MIGAYSSHGGTRMRVRPFMNRLLPILRSDSLVMKHCLNETVHLFYDIILLVFFSCDE